MKKTFIIFFILSSYLIFGQQDMASYNEKNNYYKINFPSEWQVGENSENYNQVYFYSEDQEIIASIIYENLGIKLNSKDLLDNTLNYIGVENEINEEDSYASEEELKNWNADSGNVSVFYMEQQGVNYNCILLIITKDTFYYALMFMIKENYLEDENTFIIVNNMLDSFKILK